VNAIINVYNYLKQYPYVTTHLIQYGYRVLNSSIMPFMLL